MVFFMIGYGKVIGFFEGKKLMVEIWFLNSKGLDLNIKIIFVYREKELEIRIIVFEILDCGKVELFIFLENIGEVKSFLINKEFVKLYYGELKELVEIVGDFGVDLLSVVMWMFDVMSGEKE